MEYKIVIRRWVVDEPKGWFGQMETGHIEEITSRPGSHSDMVHSALGSGARDYRNPIKEGEEFLERMYSQGWDLVSVVGGYDDSTYIFRTLYQREEKHGS
jgi:hypothetical protein